MASYLHRKGISLTVKMAIWIILIGGMVGLIVGEYLQRQLYKIFIGELKMELNDRAREDRHRFNLHIEGLEKALTVFVSRSDLKDYLTGPTWSVGTNDALLPHSAIEKGIRHYTLPPPWLPPNSVLRVLFNGRQALLLDATDTLREVYHTPGDHPESIPESLLRPTVLLKMADNGSFLTRIDGIPYIIASQAVKDGERTLATLMLASPLDDRFLAAAMGLGQSQDIIALVDPHTQRVLASSSPLIADGISLADLGSRFLILGKETSNRDAIAFFDDGRSDIDIHFTSFTPLKRLERLAGSALEKNREQWVLILLVVLLTCTLLTLIASQRLKRLTREIILMTEEELGISPPPKNERDELTILEIYFRHLAQGISSARALLQEETDGLIRMAHRADKLEAREQELRSLQTITEQLGVGILLDGANTLQPFNSLMEQLIEECGCAVLSQFSYPVEGERSGLSEGWERQELVDLAGRRRIFSLRHCPALGPRGALVHEITEQVQTGEELKTFFHFPAANPHPVLCFDRAGVLHYANDACLALFQGEVIEIGRLLPDTFLKKFQKNLGSDPHAALEITFGTRIFSFLHATLPHTDSIYLYGQEVTERRRAEEALAQEQTLLRSLIDTIPDLIFFKDIDGIFLRCNKAFIGRVGLGEQQIIGCTAGRLFSFDEAQDYRGSDQAVLSSRKSIRIEEHVVRNDGTEIIYDTIKTPFFGKDGTLLGLIGIAREITERKRTEKRIQEAEVRCRILFDLAPDGILLIDPETTKAITFNQTAHRQLGYSYEEFSQLCVSDYEVLETPEDTQHHIERILKGIGRDDFETLHRTRDGELRNVQVVVQNIDLAGRHLLHCHYHDITDIRQAEKALKEAEARLRIFARIVAATPDFISLIDRNFVYQAVNGAYLCAFSKKREDIEQHTVAELFGAEIFEELKPFLEQCLVGESVYFERGYVLPAYGHRWLEVSYHPYREQEEGLITGIVVATRDISDRKQAEQELVRRQKEIETLNAELENRVHEEVEKNRNKDLILMRQSQFAAMGEMISHIAHQWRQPINTLGLILANIEDAFQRSELTPELMERKVQKSRQLILKMSSTIDDFRNFFKPNRSKSDFLIVPIIREALSLVEASFINSNIVVELYPSFKELTVHGFPNELSQVLLVLLTNARDAIVHHGITDGAVEVRIEAEDEDILIRIADNGGGIPDSIADQIFAPFFTTKTDGHGSGIGLYMAKTIIEEHMGGTINQIQTSEGTEFRIRLPRDVSSFALVKKY
ncbi:two-component system, NtrC family, C4-dicarboxylate transport sensor histidine kinase DctB [Gammaproteobacteria bacterium]